jgi:hypothetical protein
LHAGKRGLVQAGHFPAERRALALHNVACALGALRGAADVAALRDECLIRPEALVDGDREATLGLLWHVLVHHQASP